MKIPNRIASAGLIRRAATADMLEVQRLITTFADRDQMLHRSLSELYENVRDFLVVESGGQVVGCAALHVTWKDLAELKSLAVSEEHQGLGYGRALIESCLAEAVVVGVPKVFALTYVPALFEKLGFSLVDRSLLPRKVWTECVFCPKFADCGEIAVLHDSRV